ncbi:hypothetical protein M0R45_016367 [Rubus argutus]|uniref:Uncharacterized protein n=1 Tax=Rubus argutus TaxID=59490 RepID=A0AAW1XT52_RUBAR
MTPALAHAIAEEMQEVYKNELGPESVPFTVPWETVDEEEMYFIEADERIDDDMNPKNLHENEDAASEKRQKRNKMDLTADRRWTQPQLLPLLALSFHHQLLVPLIVRYTSLIQCIVEEKLHRKGRAKGRIGKYWSF